MIKYNQKYDRWVTDTGIVYRQKSSNFLEDMDIVAGRLNNEDG